MMRSLNLIATLPYPPRSGGQLRAWNMCKHLSDRIDQTVLCRVMTPPHAADTAVFAEHHIALSTVHIPRPSALRRIVRGLRYACSRTPVVLAGWDHALMHRCLNRMLKSNPYDMVVLDGSMLCTFMQDLARSGALKVVNLYDLQAMLMRRKAHLLRPGLHKLMLIHDAWRMQNAERQMLRAADLILVTSEREQNILIAENPHYRVAVVPNGVDCREIRPLPPGRQDAILFVGSMTYAPNVDGVLHFAKQVWPALHTQHTHLSFLVVGRDPPPEIRALHHDQGIRIVGEVADLKPYYQRAILCIVPLRAAGGTRLKVLEAMAYGRPVVSTTLGCEGLETIHGTHVLIADTPDDMLRQISWLLSSPPLQATLCENGRTLVQTRYAWNVIADALYTNYAALVYTREHARLHPPPPAESVSGTNPDAN